MNLKLKLLILILISFSGGFLVGNFEILKLIFFVILLNFIISIKNWPAATATTSSPNMPIRI